MRVYNLRSTYSRHRVRLEANIALQNASGNYSIYLDFPLSYWAFLDRTGGDAFAAIGLLPAMQLGEPLQVDAPISANLYENLEYLQAIFRFYNSELKIIPIHAPIRRQRQPFWPGIRARGSFFSLGVDSFYSMQKHLPETDFPISHLILVHGFDIYTDNLNQALFPQVLENARSAARPYGLKVLDVMTNVRAFGDIYVHWHWMHGPAMAAIALALQNGFEKIYIPSSQSGDKVVDPWGSSPVIDPFWSTEKLAVRYDSFNKSRVQKIESISALPESLKYLRVCWQNPGNAYNCGQCEKCIRTMISLFCLGKLEQAETFPHEIPIQRFRELKIPPIVFDSYYVLEKQLAEIESESQQARELRAIILEKINQHD